MNFLTEYHERAMKTALYPNRGSNIIYPLLGLVDEIGETIEKLVELAKAPTLEKIDDALSEFGDVLWYFNATFWEAKQAADAQQYTTYPFASFIEMSSMKTKLLIVTDAHILRSLIIYVSKLQGIAKKAMRDNNGVLQSQKMPKFFENLVGAMTQYQRWIAHINSVYNSYLTEPVTIDTIAKENLTKLEDRKDRGVLKGDGDKR